MAPLGGLILTDLNSAPPENTAAVPGQIPVRFPAMIRFLVHDFTCEAWLARTMDFFSEALSILELMLVTEEIGIGWAEEEGMARRLASWLDSRMAYFGPLFVRQASNF